MNFRDGKSSMATDREEIEANQFAAELLMPDDAVRHEFAALESSESQQVVSELAQRFDVSRIAMEIRLVNLGLLLPQ